MDIESFQAFCLSLPGTEETFPFGPDTLVYKINGKVYALAGLDVFDGINLKCDPEQALELRERYTAVEPGYHMNKKHWNTVRPGPSLPDSLIYQWIRDSYELVKDGATKKKKKG